MMRLRRYFLPIVITGIVLALVIGASIVLPQTVEGFQLQVVDIFQRLKPRVYEDTPVRVVDIDEASLGKLGQWPWPRTRIADLITSLGDAGARVIAFDIVFSEPDRTSPGQLAELIPKTPEFETVRSKISEIPDHDLVLANTISKYNVVTGFTFTGDVNDTVPLAKAGFAFGGDNPDTFLQEFQGAIVNLPNIEASSKGNGSFNILAERDGMIRRVPLLFNFRKALYPSLYAEAVRLSQNAGNYAVKSSGSNRELSFGAPTGISSVKIGNLIVPTDSQGRIWLYSTPSEPRRVIPAWKVLSGEFNPDTAQGKIIFVGTSAIGLRDIRATALDPVAPGVEIQAQMAEQILLQDFLYRPDWATGAELTYVIVLGLILMILMPLVGALWCAAIGFISMVAVFGFSWYAFTEHQWLLDPVLPSLTCFALYLAMSLMNFLRTESEKREIRTAFTHYMSPALVAELVKNPAKLKLGGEMKNVTVLFADIRGFTKISEQFQPDELTQFMNRFLTPMTDIILKHKGTIDKYMGDCIMAFWNAPLDDPDHALHACEAALEMRAYLVKWNQERTVVAKGKGVPVIPIDIGIGINTGNCCVGNMGSKQRFDYSVLGDDVNLASRLEGQSKIYGVDMVIGETTRAHVNTLAVLELDLVRVKGKETPTHIFGLFRGPDHAEGMAFEKLKTSHEAMLEAYRTKNWEAALHKINECRTYDQEQTRLRLLYQLYENRIKAFRERPPAADWTGVTTALLK